MNDAKFDPPKEPVEGRQVPAADARGSEARSKSHKKLIFGTAGAIIVLVIVWALFGDL